MVDGVRLSSRREPDPEKHGGWVVRGSIGARCAALGVWLVILSAVPVRAADVQGTITFCTKIGESSGRLYGVAEAFPLGDERVYGVVDVVNLPQGKEQEYHILWIGPDGKTTFLKREVLTPEKSEARLTTALSLSPKRRDPGIYRLCVYRYRMLLVEKSVEFTKAEE